MAETDICFRIKRLYSHLYITRPFLALRGLDNPASLSAEISRHRKIPNIQAVLEQAFADADDPVKAGSPEKHKGKMEKFRQYSKFLIEELDGLFRGKIPVFVNGLSISDYDCAAKSGIDPYSQSHLFSTRFIEHAACFPFEVLDAFRLVYVQPVPYIQQPVVDDGVLGLEDVLRGRVLKDLDVSGQGFGTLVKFPDDVSWLGNSEFNAGLISEKDALKSLKSDLVGREMELPAESKKVKNEVLINQHLMAIKFAFIFDKLYPHFREQKEKFSLSGIPLYMEKGSSSRKVIELIGRYSQSAKFKTLDDAHGLFHFVGGNGGIVANSKDRICVNGICDDAALGRLFNYFQIVYRDSTGKTIRLKAEPSDSRPVFSYISAGKYPFLLIEQGAESGSPNLHDLAEHLVSDGTLTSYQIELVRNFSNAHRIGFSRLEPRLVELFNSDVSIYVGLRSLSKENRRWSRELDGKKIITPDRIPGFFEMPCINEKSGDFRGSGLAMPSAPKINADWVKKFNQGIAPVGCALEKIVGRLPNADNIILRQLELAGEDVCADFYRFHNENLESIPALRGTAIHALSSAPLDNLIHYRTLERIGLKPVSSDLYTETPFYHELDGFSVSLHPDCYLFLERADGKHDLLILDTKSNRYTPYPEHKYLQQTFFYGWVIKQCVEKHLAMKIENIYSVLNKNAFHKGFGESDSVAVPHTTFRPQRFSPITLFTPDDFMHQAVPYIVNTLMSEQKDLKSGSIDLPAYKAEKERCGACRKCYNSNVLICNYVAEQAAKGKCVEELIK